MTRRPNPPTELGEWALGAMLLAFMVVYLLSLVVAY